MGPRPLPQWRGPRAGEVVVPSWLVIVISGGGVPSLIPAFSVAPSPFTMSIVSGAVRGVALGIDGDGALLVRSDAGHTHRIVAGEVGIDAARH